MYQILCDKYPLFDVRDDDLIVTNPKCKLAVNTVGEASFSIYQNHPYYDRLQKLKSVFEILQDGETIFRGRMTEDSIDFDNKKDVDLEGAMAYFNDSVIPPYVFPDDFTNDSGYIEASGSGGNVVTFFLGWLIDQHNSQVDEFQQFKLGRVTVSDKNNYITRASEDYASTWDVVSNKLFKSALGGYLCIRYEPDGNYIDYLEDFDLTNTQRIEYGENLLDISTDSDATSTYSALIPLGAKLKEIYEESENESRLTIFSLPDGNITDDLVKKGNMIYSKSAKEKYGWICCPPKDTTWNDITTASGLQAKAVEYMGETATKLKNKISITAVDLHFSDAEIESFRIYRYCQVLSRPHNHEDVYKLTELDIDLIEPQNTKITLGEESLSLTDINAGIRQSVVNTALQTVEIAREAVYNEVKTQVDASATSILADCEQIIMTAVSNYVETGNFSEFRETIAAQLTFMAEQLELNFSETTSRIEDVDGDLQEKFNTITKYFTFDINGLTIGQADNRNKVIIDSDEMSILVNDVVVQKFDAHGQALIPELTVTKKLDLFGFLMEQDSEGRVNCEYVGG